MNLIDPITGALILDPVVAADGHAYDRSSITEYIASCTARGEPLVSPEDRTTPMGSELKPAPAYLVAELKQLHEDAKLSPAQTGSQQCKSLEALKALFDVLDPLGDLLATTLDGWQTPTVMVFWNETSGKSSLLERLSMMPLLPRGEDTCTRLPIVLKLRHTKEAQLPVLVVRDSASGKEEVRRVVSVAGGETDVRREMGRIIEQ